MPLVVSGTVALVASAAAGPWIGTGDPWLRADIEYLSDQGLIEGPINTWPVMWGGIRRDLNEIQRRKPAKDTLRMTMHLDSAFRNATSPATQISLRAASDPEVLRSFADTPRDDAELVIRRSNMGEHWAFNLEAHHVADPVDNEDFRLDGSYLAGVIGNWSLSAGYIEQWWGPGWESSLILSNNARPAPGLLLQRNYADPMAVPWLRWIGPWSMTAFINVLDDERVINNARHLGLSVSFRPLPSLEIGLRRTAQWGGAGRPESFDSFVELLLGKDNCGSDACRPDEPGNQLGGIDMSWRLPIQHPATVYVQFIGEDEAGGLPSKQILQLGLRTSMVLLDRRLHLYTEYQDTSTNLGDEFNVTYNHSIYQSGYRYYGRSLGSTYDNDSEVLTLGLLTRLTPVSGIRAAISHFDINRDGADNMSVAPHSVTSSRRDGWSLALNYSHQMPLGDLGLFLHHASDRYDERGRIDGRTWLGVDWALTLR